MGIISIILLIATGSLLILLELFLLPGMVVGLIGTGLCFWGVYESFHTFGATGGWWTLIGTIIINGIVAYWAFQNLHRSRFAMKEKIDGRVNEFDDHGLQIGEVGTSISDIRPEGKAMFGDMIISVWSLEGRFISANQQLRIEKMYDNKIFVTTF